MKGTADPEPGRESPERHKGIYILPNLFTTAGLFAGFYAIIQATRGEYDNAAIAIFVAMIMDGLDGRIARWTGTTSEFGKEYDSLADLIAFGVAPALVMYEWTLVSGGRIGWMAAFLYVAATALRLARFNTVVVEEKRYFQGLPCPAAAATVAACVWLFHFLGAAEADITGVAVVVTVALALAMISSIPYRSFKDIDLKGRISFPAAFLFAIVLAIIFWEPPIVLFAVTLVYAISGPVAFIFSKLTGSSKVESGTEASADPANASNDDAQNKDVSASDASSTEDEKPADRSGNLH